MPDIFASRLIRGTWYQHGLAVADRVGRMQLCVAKDGSIWSPVFRLALAPDGVTWSGWPDGITFRESRQ